MYQRHPFHDVSHEKSSSRGRYFDPCRRFYSVLTLIMKPSSIEKTRSFIIVNLLRCGHVSEVKEFNEWLKRQPHKHKIIIAGNHELRYCSRIQSSFHTLYLFLSCSSAVLIPHSNANRRALIRCLRRPEG